jgi:AAA15 family ATPase/GTPase
MLQQFSVGNFKSFKDIMTLSLVAANYKEKRENNIFLAGKKTKLLKSAAIYGANASGKSNLLYSILFMKNFVLNSSKENQLTDQIGVLPFMLDNKLAAKPSYFEIVFFQSNIKYRYGFEVSNTEVHSEWLFKTGTTKESKLFTRIDNVFDMGSSFKEGKGLIEKTRKNALFLSVVAQFNGTISKEVILWFNNLSVMSGLTDDSFVNSTREMLEKNDPKKKSELLNFLKIADLGIEDIETTIEPMKADHLPPFFTEEIKKQILDSGNAKNISIFTVHKKYENDKEVGLEKFQIGMESEGTKKIFFLALPMLDALENGKVLIIDELDSRLHPLITEYIIKLFNSKHNSKNSQLIFATHDTNLLSSEMFRRDQIWFTEKDKSNATELHSLVEYKTRNKGAYDKNYLLGKYGAIPAVDK